MSVIDSPASWDALTIAEKIMECSAFDELPGFNFFQLPRVAMILQTRPETFSAIQSNFECCNFDDIWKSSALHAVKADAIAHQIKASVPLQAKPDFKIIHLMHLIGSLNRSNQLDAISSHIDNGDWDTVWVCPSVYEARQVAIGKKIMASDALRKKPGFHLLKRHIRKLGLPRMELMLKDIMADNWDSVWECKEFSSFKEEVIIELILESNTLKQKPGFKFLDPKYLDLWQDDPDVLDELLSNLNDDDMDRVWASEAIREAITKAKDQAKDNTTVRVGSISDLQKAWNDEFIPQTLSTFIEAITANHRTFDITKHYSKFTPIVQSSGVGKSRLVDEFSKKVLGILFTFRMNDDTGYPPGDPEIRKYIMDHMQRPNDESVARPMAVAASLIAASISSMHSLVRAGLHTLGQGQYGNLLDYLHKEMAPVALRVATEDRALSPTNQKIQGTRSLKVATEDRALSPTGRKVQGTRSPVRRKFCTNVSELARSILEEFANDVTWETAIDSDPTTVWDNAVKEHPLFVQRLLKPLDGLLEELEVSGLGDPSIPIKLFFSFDEVSNIIDGKNRTMLDCLHKVIRFLSEKPIWAFVLSTKTPMGSTTPAAGAEASLRLSERKLERVAPFYTFAFDLEANHNFKVDRRKQLEKSLDTFSTREHMISFGRPLWNIYRTSPYSDIRELALIKLLGGVHGGVVYSPGDLNHVLAMLSVRVCLDPCLQTSRAIEMASSAVDSHLRVIMQMNPDYGLMKTASPPEPILAEAAAFGLRAKHREQNPWVPTLKVLFTELLSGGLVDKGTAGELGTRVLPIMARDRLFDSVTGNDGPIYANHFKVSEFLGSLFQPQYITLLGLQSAHNFLAGRMNFTHFACTDKHVRSTEMRGLLHTLLMTQAALQSCHDQEFWDLLIPVYFGPPDKPFNLDQVSALFIQVKNRKRALSQQLTKEGWGRCFDWNEAKVPVLFLQLELEVKNPKQHFKNIMSEFPEVHAGRVIGFSKENYRDPQGGDDSRYWIQQLLQPSPTSLGIQQNNQDQVLRFNQLTPETCFFGYREGKKHELGDDGGVVQENVKKQKTGHEE